MRLFFFYWSNKKVSACPFTRWLSTFSCTPRFRAIRRDFRWFGGCVAPWSSDQDAAGWTPLSWAVLHGSAEMAQVLVRTVAQVQQRRRLEWIRIIHQGPKMNQEIWDFFWGEGTQNIWKIYDSFKQLHCGCNMLKDDFQAMGHHQSF